MRRDFETLVSKFEIETYAAFFLNQSQRPYTSKISERIEKKNDKYETLRRQDHSKTRLRDPSKTIQRFRDRVKNFQDSRFFEVPFYTPSLNCR